jgi:hypothetical protein
MLIEIQILAEVNLNKTMGIQELRVAEEEIEAVEVMQVQEDKNATCNKSKGRARYQIILSLVLTLNF